MPEPCSCPLPQGRISRRGDFPGAVNSIPSRVRIEVDVRDIDQARRDSVLNKIAAACDEVSRRRGVAVRTEVVNADPPAKCGPAVVEALANACDTHGLRYDRMISRAYRDSLFMSRMASAAMLFIPCRGGVSHRPDEYWSPEAIVSGNTRVGRSVGASGGLRRLPM